KLGLSPHSSKPHRVSSSTHRRCRSTTSPLPRPPQIYDFSTLNSPTMAHQSVDEKEKKKRKEEAQTEKETGNAAYKRKEFEKATGCYMKAIELDDEDISFFTKRAAVYLEMGKYDECFQDWFCGSDGGSGSDGRRWTATTGYLLVVVDLQQR
ncbi:hypothetical protein Drorol1_Dr00022592, partial [Drosera rotundifolia]